MLDGDCDNDWGKDTVEDDLCEQLRKSLERVEKNKNIWKQQDKDFRGLFNSVKIEREPMERKVVTKKPAVRLGATSPGTLRPDWDETFLSKVVGQEGASSIVPYIKAYQAGLAPLGRPAGIFLLIGPTGVGKTRTVEALATALHANPANLIRIDCAEYQMEHEVAKLIGAPPGYLGHRETHPVITQAKLAASTSDGCRLSIVLFDEVEKAARSLWNLLLGIMDRGVLTLGDNMKVHFTDTIVIMTANTGAREMQKEIAGGFGFPAERVAHPERAAMSATRKMFSPEFLNRIDEIITYHPLSQEALYQILDLQIAELQGLLDSRVKSVKLHVTKPAKDFLISRADCSRYAARELKRVVQRHLQQGLSAKLLSCGPLDSAVVLVNRLGESLQFKVTPNA